MKCCTGHRAPVYPYREVIHKSVELVDKLLVAGKQAGTAVAFASNDKVYALTAAHAILDEGIIVSDIKAFGIQLKCKGYRVEPDIAILEPANKAEHLDAGFQPVDNAEVYVGVTATMLSYPESLDIPPPAGCQTTTGTITGYDDVMTYAFASYPGGANLSFVPACKIVAMMNTMALSAMNLQHVVPSLFV